MNAVLRHVGLKSSKTFYSFATFPACTLNPKCVFSVSKSTFLCHLVKQKQFSGLRISSRLKVAGNRLHAKSVQVRQSSSIFSRLKFFFNIQPFSVQESLPRQCLLTVTVCGISLCLVFSYFNPKTILVSKVYADNKNRNNFVADVVEKSSPAVVFLEIKGSHPITGKPVTLTNGSGFIVRSNGIILTNAHVVANKPRVSVKMFDGRLFEGQVTAVDPILDLAAVKIDATNLPIIPLGDSSRLRPGEWVIAMGSPLSLSNTVTCGIVSSVGRGSKELGLRNISMNYIQTDAVINFGNSGGPLVDLEGHAIGINTMKVTTGISFAIPASYAHKFLVKAEAIMDKGENVKGYPRHRYMGITMLSLNENIISELKKERNLVLPDINEGVFVYKVIPGSPAHNAGLVPGDIIVNIGKQLVKSAADVYDAVEKTEKLYVTVIRGRQMQNITINTLEAI